MHQSSKLKPSLPSQSRVARRKSQRRLHSAYYSTKQPKRFSSQTKTLKDNPNGLRNQMFPNHRSTASNRNQNLVRSHYRKPASLNRSQGWRGVCKHKIQPHRRPHSDLRKAMHASQKKHNPSATYLRPSGTRIVTGSSTRSQAWTAR